MILKWIAMQKYPFHFAKFYIKAKNCIKRKAKKKNMRKKPYLLMEYFLKVKLRTFSPLKCLAVYFLMHPPLYRSSRQVIDSFIVFEVSYFESIKWNFPAFFFSLMEFSRCQNLMEKIFCSLLIWEKVSQCHEYFLINFKADFSCFESF